MERVDGEHLFRVAHSVLPHAGGWRVWYCAGSTWAEEGQGRLSPSYDIRVLDSIDGVRLGGEGRPCLSLRQDEVRLGRPWVTRERGDWTMLFGVQRAGDGYRLSAARSADGERWERAEFVLWPPEGPWDARANGYPAVVTVGGQTILFYNGDDMGRAGVCAAVAIR